MKMLIVSLIAVCLLVAGCPSVPSPPSSPGLYCEMQYDMPCTTGFIELCVSLDGETCIVKAVGRSYSCDCASLDYGGCDAAMEAAINRCFGYDVYNTDDPVLLEDLGISDVEEVVAELKERLSLIK